MMENIAENSVDCRKKYSAHSRRIKNQRPIKNKESNNEIVQANYMKKRLQKLMVHDILEES